GILNSHRRFFLSYAAPVLWNLAIIGAILAGRGTGDLAQLARWTAWGAAAGSLLQLAVQVPTVRMLLGTFRPSLDASLTSVRQVLKGFGSVVVGRGVVQVSAYVDTAFASLISERALSALAYAQTIYLLPVSLFGMAVSASELAEMSHATGTGEEVARHVRARMDGGLRRMAFFIVPSAAALLVLGDVVAAALLQTGRFGAGDTRYLWYVLAGSALGLFASTQGRLYASAFYALKEPRTPLRFAVARVAVNALLAWGCVVVLPRWFGWPRDLAAVGVTATSGLAACIEFTLLRRALCRRIGTTGLSPRRHLQLWGAALAAVSAGLGVKVALVARSGADVSVEWAGSVLPMPQLSPLLTAAVVLPVVAGVYGLACLMLRVEEASGVVARVTRRLRR
ncbi:MAG: integral rane protein MviN, partial [Pseudomonadota bacterium]